MTREEGGRVGNLDDVIKKRNNFVHSKYSIVCPLLDIA
jgi:hypothetical protein